MKPPSANFSSVYLLCIQTELSYLSLIARLLPNCAMKSYGFSNYELRIPNYSDLNKSLMPPMLPIRLVAS